MMGEKKRPNRNHQRLARVLQDHCGCRYVEALRKVRSFVRFADSEAYFDRVESLPDDGRPRCVECLLPTDDGGHENNPCAPAARS